MTNNNNKFLSYMWKDLTTINCWSYSNVVLASLTFLTLDNVQASLHRTRLIEKFLRSSFSPFFGYPVERFR